VLSGNRQLQISSMSETHEIYVDIKVYQEKDVLPERVPWQSDQYRQELQQTGYQVTRNDLGGDGLSELILP
jgi:hypothetical protein